MREIVDINKGYVKIANNLFDNIIFRDFTNRERAVICLIIRLSYGFNHKTAIIKPKSRFTLIGLHRQDINTILKILVDKKVIISYGDNIYALNKHFDEWQVGLNKFFNAENFNDLKALQFSKDVSTGLTNNVSPTLTNSKEVCGPDLQNQEICKSQTYTTVSPTLTKNGKMYGPDLQEQPENADSEGNINPPKDIIKDNINTLLNTSIKENEEENNKKNTPKIDPYFNNPVADKFKAEYKKIFKKSDCYLDNFKLNKLLEINADNPEFLNLLPEILTKYSKLNFTNGKPSLKWLIIEGGWAGILNGEYDQYISEDKKDSNSEETWSLDEIAKNDNYDEDLETLRKMGLV